MFYNKATENIVIHLSIIYQITLVFLKCPAGGLSKLPHWSEVHLADIRHIKSILNIKGNRETEVCLAASVGSPNAGILRQE